jgi:hypothetical protein
VDVDPTRRTVMCVLVPLRSGGSATEMTHDRVAAGSDARDVRGKPHSAPELA